MNETGSINTTQYFSYGDKEVEYLCSRDARLGRVIDKVGHIYRDVDPDLFHAVVHHIVGQQISTKAQATIWNRICIGLGTVDATTIIDLGVNNLQQFGISFRKASYIMDFADKVKSGELDIDKIYNMPDDEVIKELVTLKGVGVWTAEMILLFCLQRPNVFSYDDLAIQRGLKTLYHHRQITSTLFNKYRRHFNPYCSTASLYLWAVAGDPALADD